VDGPLKTAVVGLGWWGTQIVQSVAGSDIIDIVRGVDPRAAELQDFAAANGLTVADDFDDAVTDPGIDAVMIVTPHRLHEAQATAAARAGKHVFCEKPLALDSAAAARILESCRSRGLALGIGHERRFEGALERAAGMVRSGELGTLLHIECNWSHNLFKGNAATSWRQDPAQAPAGTLTALGVHITDYFQSVAGRVATLRAVSAHRSEDFPSDDVISVQFQFASGVTGLMANLATTPFHSRITLYGDRGWVEAREVSNVDIPDPAVLTWRGMDNEIHTRTYAHSNTVRANIEQWAAAALGQGEYRFTDDQLLHNVEILEAIVRSSDAGGTVESVGAP
jgi:predicted dehydrogenase